MDVSPQDYDILLGRLQHIASNHLTKATFTASSAKKYLVNRVPTKAPLVLSPSQNEAKKFQQINKALLKEFNKFNASQGKHYKFHQDVLPNVYDPHVTLLTSTDIQNLGLNRDHVLNQINPVLKARPMELLHEPKPALKKSSGKKTKDAAPKTKAPKGKKAKKSKPTKGKKKKVSKKKSKSVKSKKTKGKKKKKK